MSSLGWKFRLGLQPLKSVRHDIRVSQCFVLRVFPKTYRASDWANAKWCHWEFISGLRLQRDTTLRRCRKCLKYGSRQRMSSMGWNWNFQLGLQHFTLICQTRYSCLAVLFVLAKYLTFHCSLKEHSNGIVSLYTVILIHRGSGLGSMPRSYRKLSVSWTQNALKIVRNY